ncbi:hypothetical protein ACIPSG_03785 [Pectobacterium sp. CHL-2024]|uniref:hypothetical protein n=1 Tax=Pectobacterium sp. CHL-2024 TaxID=3377079 RepID=UPI00382CD7AE
MATTHLDETSETFLEEGNIRIVTITQKMVKKSQVIKILLKKGIESITEEDILAEVGARDNVWQEQAQIVLDEITPHWPKKWLFPLADASLYKLADDHSVKFGRYQTEENRSALLKALRTILPGPVWHDVPPDFSRQEELQTDLMVLDGKLVSALTDTDEDLLNAYFTGCLSRKIRVTFTRENGSLEVKLYELESDRLVPEYFG